MTAPTACPACGAAVRPDSPWCTLCYADLRPKAADPEPAPAPDLDPGPAPDPFPAPSVGPSGPVPAADPFVSSLVPSPALLPSPAPDPLSDPLAPPAVPTPAPVPTWPCTTCGTQNAMERDTCAGCGAGFLAAARAHGPLLELPVVGDITRLGRTQRFALAGGVVFVFLLLTLLVGVLLG